jgi:4-hydroxybenzoate polyprenyltransferase
MHDLLPYIELMRPRQWIKNVFVIAPVVFSYSFLYGEKIIAAFTAFLLFSLAASCIYIVNDIIDISYDQHSRLKSKRPLARRAVSTKSAWVIAIVLGLGTLTVSFFFSHLFLLAVSAYIVLNLSYTFFLKHLVLLDLLAVALSLVLRVLAGIAAIRVMPSPWILIVTFFIGLFIISTKRLLELDLAAKEERRRVLGDYSREFLKHIMLGALIITLTSYVLYAILVVQSTIFLLTILPVSYGLLRFLWIAEEKQTATDDLSGILLHDPPLLSSVIIFALIAITIFIYVSPPLSV